MDASLAVLFLVGVESGRWWSAIDRHAPGPDGKALFIGVGSLFAGYAAARGAGVRSDVALALGLAASEISVRAWSNASKKTQAAVAPPVARPTVPREPPRRFAS